MRAIALYVCASCAALLLAGCSGQREPAQKSISDIDGMVAVASLDAAKYVPDRLREVQSEVGGLRASFDQGAYSAVLERAPAVMSDAHGLVGAAASARDGLAKALGERWTSLAAAVPAEVSAIRGRIDDLGARTGKKSAASVDAGAARTALGGDTALWSKAQAAFATGNMDEAVATATDVKGKLDGLAAALKLDVK